MRGDGYRFRAKVKDFVVRVRVKDVVVLQIETRACSKNSNPPRLGDETC